jgi:hypothetical protein
MVILRLPLPRKIVVFGYYQKDTYMNTNAGMKAFFSQNRVYKIQKNSHK